MKNKSRIIDITGQRFNRWKVLSYAGNDKHKKALWKCECVCGTTKLIHGVHLIRGNTKSCGCYKSEIISEHKKKDLAGKIFGNLLVLKCAGQNHRNNYLWLCKCVCGKKTTVVGSDLISGHVKSCGCYRSSIVSRRMRKDLVGKRFGKLVVIKEVGRADTVRKQILWLCACDCGNRTVVRSGGLLSGSTRSCGCYKREVNLEFMRGENNPGYGKFGKLNPNWKGGVSCEPYCDVWTDKEYKESIKERDSYTCQNPYCWGTSKRLTIHHIDYDKKNCGPDNLITLCNSCNSRANYGREYWKNLYKNMISKI